MLASSPRTTRLPLLLVVFPLLLGGCGGNTRTVVTQFPRWEFKDYPRVAVLPVTTKDRDGLRSADIVTDELTAALTRNGAFEVISRAELKDVLTEQDLSRLADVADPSTVLPTDRIQAAQALVVARITEHSLLNERAEKRIPRYAVDRRGRTIRDRYGRRLVVGEDVVEVYRVGATLAGSVRVIDAATGRVLLSHAAQPIKIEDSQSGRPPRATAQEMAAAAARELAVDFYKQIAPSELNVELTDEMLLVATEFFDGEYSESSELPPDLNEFLLVVRDLPRECDRNTFILRIQPEDSRATLWEQQFTWSASAGRRGMQFAVPLKLLTAAAAPVFVAKLYSGPDSPPILETDFSVGPTR